MVVRLAGFSVDVDAPGSKVFWTESGVFPDPGQRGRSELLAIVEAEGEVRPPGTLQLPMRTNLLLKCPSKTD